MKQALKLAFQTLKLSKETMESARKKIDELKAENKALKEALTQEKTLQALHSENERLGLYKDAYAEQEQVIQNSTCARHCEANAFQITIKNLKAQLATSPQRTKEKNT